MKNIAGEKIIIGEIPLFVIREKDNKNFKATVFLYHGWSSKKENYLFMANLFALSGFQVIIPDSLHHGERGSIDYDDKNVMEEHFWRVVFNSVDEFFLLDSQLKELGVLKSEKKAVMGSSMGGMISAGIFARDKEIDTMIVMNGACAWQDLDKRVKEKREIDRSAKVEDAKMSSYDPFNSLRNIYPRPFLLQHGEDDSSVPIESQEYFYNEAVSCYGPLMDRIAFSKIPNLNHHKTIGMIEEGIGWLNALFEENQK